MVQQQEVTKQLKRIKADFHLWGRGEARELHRVLLPGERIDNAVMGRYNGGFAMLCITDQRILLIDKKPFYLTLEDIRYDMLSELDYRHQLLEATLHIQTINKQLRFTSWDRRRMEAISAYVQQRVTELRQHSSNPSEAHQRTLPSDPTPPMQQIKVPLATAQPAPAINDADTSHPASAANGRAWWRPTLGEYVVATQLESTVRHNPPSQFSSQAVWQPLTRRINPYATTPLLLRRRVSRSLSGR